MKMFAGLKNKKNSYRGKVRIGTSTKKLVERLQPSDIALIDHADLDEMAAESLLRTRVKAVINTGEFVTGRFANPAPRRLLEAGVLLLEIPDRNLFNVLKEGDIIHVKGEVIMHNDNEIARGNIFSRQLFEQRMETARRRAFEVAGSFFDNTLHYAAGEKELLLSGTNIPAVKTPIKGRDAVVVVRGKNYRDDLQILRQYIKEARPVLIGVDGGADALWEAGFRPDIVMGDMDSVSDKVLRLAGEIVVHAYPRGGHAPGADRVEKLGLEYTLYTVPGTSEDTALLLAYDKGAEIIVALGTHFGVTEFLEKGRKGMSSTLLVRLKVGDRLVDAKGVSRLYKSARASSLVPVVFLAGLLPVAILLLLSPLVMHFFRVLLWRIGIGP